MGVGLPSALEALRVRSVIIPFEKLTTPVATVAVLTK